MKAIRFAVNPVETLLVVDAMTGQDAVTTATAFNQALGITGIVMTRLDGDARGGAALSMRAVTGAPIKLAGTGEKLDALDEFNPERIAGRILGFISYERPFRMPDAPRVFFHPVVINNYGLFKYPDYTLPLSVKMAEVSRDHQLDDQGRAPQSGFVEGQPQEARGGGVRDIRAGGQQAAQAVR